MFEQLKRQTILYSILSMLFGLILAVYPVRSLKLMAMIVGWGVLAGGIAALVGFVTGWRNHQTLARAIIGILAGLAILLRPGFFVAIIPFIVGALIAANACIRGAQAFKGANRSQPGWVRGFVMALIGLLIGCFIMINPFGSVSILVIIAGVGLIYSGLMGLLFATK